MITIYYYYYLKMEGTSFEHKLKEKLQKNIDKKINDAKVKEMLEKKECMDIFNKYVKKAIDRYMYRVDDVQQHLIDANGGEEPKKSIPLFSVVNYRDIEDYAYSHSAYSETTMTNYITGNKKEKDLWEDSLKHHRCLENIKPYADMYLKLIYKNIDTGKYVPTYNCINEETRGWDSTTTRTGYGLYMNYAFPEK